MKIHILFSGCLPEGSGINTIRQLHPDKISALWNLKHCLIRQVYAQLIAENFNPLTIDVFEALDMGL